jgi:hypothetical protein
MSCLRFGFVLCVGAATAAAGGHHRIELLPIARAGGRRSERRRASLWHGLPECADLQCDEPGELHPHRRLGKAVHREGRRRDRRATSDPARTPCPLCRVFDEGEVLLLDGLGDGVRFHVTSAHRGVDDAQRAARTWRSGRESRRRAGIVASTVAARATDMTMQPSQNLVEGMIVLTLSLLLGSLSELGTRDVTRQALGASQGRNNRVITGMISQVSATTISTLSTSVRSGSGQEASVGPSAARIAVMTA